MLYDKILFQKSEIKEARYKNAIVWELDTGPKAFIFGDVDGVKTEDIEACIKTTDFEIAGKQTYDFLNPGAVDNEAQIAVRDASRKNKNLTIIVGGHEVGPCTLLAETFKDGDPSYSGVLGGIALGLKTYHICEPEIKYMVDPAIYEDHVEMMEMAIDVEEIHKELKAIREN